ncbi:hypothetical protein FRB93_009043 [Tulasnella sp. JGI-2019a]|nr:hypothetical protein FRB93_009043 [Tulasnella sp. JGI-2019a]
MATYGRPSLDMNGHSDNPFMVSSTINTTSMNAQLAKILDDKENELVLAGNLGQRILAQRVELEERINALAEHEHRSGSRTPEPGGDPEVAKKFQELQDILQSWDKENQETLGGFNGQKVCGCILSLHSTSFAARSKRVFLASVFPSKAYQWTSKCQTSSNAINTLCVTREAKPSRSPPRT